MARFCCSNITSLGEAIAKHEANTVRYWACLYTGAAKCRLTFSSIRTQHCCH